MSDDVSVAGFEDHPPAELWTPSLTTVRQDFAGLGARALSLLMEHASEPADRPRPSSERPPVVIRDSTAPPPARRRRANLVG